MSEDLIQVDNINDHRQMISCYIIKSVVSFMTFEDFQNTWFTRAMFL